MTLPVPSPDAAAHSQRLYQAIRAEIAGNGDWMSFAQFMALALYAPGLGYYSAGARKFGAAGDFVTVVSARAAALATGIGTRAVDWAPPPRRPFAALTHPDRHRSRALAAMLAILDAPEPAPPG